MLVPTRGRPGRLGLFQFNDSMTQKARLAKALAGYAIQAGFARFLLRERFSTAEGSADAGRDLIESELPRLLSVPRVEVAISIGRSLRPNIKPVLEIMAPDGEVLAFGKLAWNQLTSELVENEVATLTKLEGRTIRSFRVPRVIHRGAWDGFSLVLLSPLRHGVLRRAPVDALPRPAVLRELAGLVAGSTGPLIGGPYWQKVSARALSVAHLVQDGQRLESAISNLAERLSSVEVVHCMSHGDFAPWNMLHAPGCINLWDWERSSDARPLGFDALHFTFEVAHYKEGLDPSAAADAALERSQDVLRDLGVPPPTAAAIRDVYLLDRLTRLMEGRQASVAVDDRLLDRLAASIIAREEGRAGD